MLRGNSSLSAFHFLGERDSWVTLSTVMDVKLPNLGETVDSGVVVNVLVTEGQKVAKGDPLIEIESEKAIATVPSPAEGVVAKLHVRAGEKIAVGQRILTFAGSGTEAPAEVRQAEEPPAPVAQVQESRPTVPQQGPEPVQEPAEVEPPAAHPPAASPSIRHIARELGIDLSRVRGTGRGGRILMTDLRAYIQRLQKLAASAGAVREREQPAAVQVDFSKWGPITIKPLSPLRQTISRRMSESWHTVPRVTQFDEPDITRLVELRERYKAAYEAKGVRLTLTGLLVRCVVLALQKHPIINASLDSSGENIVYKSYYHLGIAVDTEAGLIVPVMRDADKKTLLDISRELEELARKARERKVSGEELRGGTFTISNQGGIGGTHFTPIINLPEVAILGVGRGAMKPVWRDGRVEPRHLVPVSLSYDHRIVDGGEAARFIVDLAKAAAEFDEAFVRL